MWKWHNRLSEMIATQFKMIQVLQKYIRLQDVEIKILWKGIKRNKNPEYEDNMN